MYKLIITTGQGPSKRTITQQFFMTQQGLHNAEEIFDQAQHRPEVMELRLFRQDLHGMNELKRWRRVEE